MEDKKQVFCKVKESCPEVLLKVVGKEAPAERDYSSGATFRQGGISRSSFYKYKDMIFSFMIMKGKTITLVVQMDDEQGLLS